MIAVVEHAKSRSVYVYKPVANNSRGSYFNDYVSYIYE